MVKLGGTTLGTFPLDNTIQAALPGFDATGTARSTSCLPAGAGAPPSSAVRGQTDTEALCRSR